MRRLEITMYETVPGPGGKDQIVSTNHSCSMHELSAAKYASSTNFSRYFLELVRQLDRNLDSAIVEFKEKHKLP